MCLRKRHWNRSTALSIALYTFQQDITVRSWSGGLSAHTLTRNARTDEYLGTEADVNHAVSLLLGSRIFRDHSDRLINLLMDLAEEVCTDSL